MTSIDKDALAKVSTGNIFADLELPDPDIMLAKASLALRIRLIIKSQVLPQAGAAKLLGMSKQEFSAFMHNKLDEFSICRLFCLLNKLGCDVHLTISEPRPDHQGKILVELSDACGANALNK